MPNAFMILSAYGFITKDIKAKNSHHLLSKENNLIYLFENSLELGIDMANILEDF